MTIHAVSQLPLAPLGAGDLIDRTVRVYRRNFVALVRASAPPVVISAAGAVLWAIGTQGIPVTGSGQRLFLYVGLAIIGVVLIAVGTLFHLIVMGGATRNLVMHLMWHEPVSARAIYRSVRARFWGLCGATVVVGAWIAVASGVALVVWYIVLIIVVIGGVAGVQAGAPSAQSIVNLVLATIGIVMVVGATLGAVWLFFWLVGRVAYVPQVMLVEGCGVFAAVSRSVALARGNTRRLMAMFLFTTFATYSALMLLLIPLGWYGYLNGINPFSLTAADWPTWYAVGYQVVTQLSTILLTPVWMLGLSLLYVEERVRHEGFDIELMAARVLGEIPSLPAGGQAPLTPAIAAATAAVNDTASAIWAEQHRAGAKTEDGSMLGLTER